MENKTIIAMVVPKLSFAKAMKMHMTPSTVCQSHKHHNLPLMPNLREAQSDVIPPTDLANMFINP